ncbi:MAG: biopolymer transporter ExbD [Pseudomonadota bacterium]
MEIKRISKKTFSDINMTPFVDVVLVLLIIFMITAPLLEQGIKINLPAAKGGAFEKEEQPVIIALKDDKTIFLNSQEIPEASLDKRIDLMFKNRKNKSIFVRADERLPYGFVAKIISRIKEGGVEKIGLVTLPTENK